MAHQLPLNNLGVGSGGNHLVNSNAPNNGGNFPTTPLADHHDHEYNSNSYHHNYPPPPPYPSHHHAQHMDNQIVSPSVGCGPCSSSSIAGSLPPITSFGIRQSSTSSMQLAGIGPSTSAQLQLSSIDSPCTDQIQQQNHFNNQTSSVSADASHHRQFNTQRHFTSAYVHSHQPQNHGAAGPMATNSHASQQYLGGTHTQNNAFVILENHQSLQQQQMPSPAISSSQLANSISNPGSIVSAPPESPCSSIRSPSVRSNYSIRMVNTTPDPFTNNSEHSYSSDVHQDSLLPQQNQLLSEGTQQYKLQQQQPLINLKSMKRTYTPRTSATGISKTPTSTVLPLLQTDNQTANASLLSPASAGGNDGPTVRQHLQLQQAANKQRLQNEFILRRIRTQQDDGEKNIKNSMVHGGAEEMSRPQIESAPPSVAVAQLTSDGGPSPSLGSQQVDSSSLSPLPTSSSSYHVKVASSQHLLHKTESLSPPKRNNNRLGGAARAGQAQKGTKHNLASSNQSAPSSSEALASTIASVASGAGSFEEFEKLSSGTTNYGVMQTGNAQQTTTSSAAFSSPSSCSSSLMLPVVSSSSSSTEFGQMAQQSPATTKRRKILSTPSVVAAAQQLQKGNAIQPPPPLAPVQTTTNHHSSTIDHLMMMSRRESVPNFGVDDLMMSPNKTSLQSLQTPHQQQCRIHVQNPPPQQGDFPMTGTKIHVVRMQPGPASLAASPQSALSPHPSVLARPSSETPFGHHHSPFAAPSSAGNTPEVGALTPTAGQHMAYSPRAPPFPASPFQAVQTSQQHHQHSQVSQQLRYQQQQFTMPAPPTPGTPTAQGGGNVQQQFQPNSHSSAASSPSPMGVSVQSPHYLQQQQCAQQQPLHNFQHPIQNQHLLVRQQSQQYLHQQQNSPVQQQSQCFLPSSGAKYPPPSPSFRQQMTAQYQLQQQPQNQPAQAFSVPPGPQHHRHDGNVSSFAGSVAPSPSPQQQQHCQQMLPAQRSITGFHQQQAVMLPSYSPTSAMAPQQPSPRQTTHFGQGGQVQQQQPILAMAGGASLPIDSDVTGNRHHETTTAGGMLPPPSYGQQSNLPPQQQYLYQQQQHHLQQQQQQQHHLPPPSLHQQQVVRNTPASNQLSSLPPRPSPHHHLPPPPTPQQQHHLPQSPMLSSPPSSYSQKQPVQMLPASNSHPHLQQLLHQPLTPSQPSFHNQQQSSSSAAMVQIPAGGPAAVRVFASTPALAAPPPATAILSSPQQQQQMVPPRAQLSRAQVLNRHNRELESRKYAVKLYHLQRTIKALVYKNGALADELARLNQRIHVVTDERRVLAKRVQHHERNRIRRIQNQCKKAAAAAMAMAETAIPEKAFTPMEGHEHQGVNSIGGTLTTGTIPVMEVEVKEESKTNLDEPKIEQQGEEDDFLASKTDAEYRIRQRSGGGMTLRRRKTMTPVADTSASTRSIGIVLSCNVHL